MTSCQTFYCTNEKGKCEKNCFFFVITDQDYPCQHIDQWPWKSFNCRYNPRMDYAFCLLTLKSYEKWWFPLFGATCNFNDQILPYIYLLIFTKSLWLHVKHFIALMKRESVRRIFFVIIPPLIEWNLSVCSHFRNRYLSFY
jgi:hypothetical protein